MMAHGHTVDAVVSTSSVYRNTMLMSDEAIPYLMAILIYMLRICDGGGQNKVQQ